MDRIRRNLGPGNQEVLELYKSRDGSEKLFRGDESYLGAKSTWVYHDEPAHSKIFIEFVALIIRNKIYGEIKTGNDRVSVV